ncbi:MAG: hypothetical protein ACKKL6_01745 [Candidatus Komeilibacteria bacterium]
MKTNLQVALVGCIAVIIGCVIATVNGIKYLEDSSWKMPSGDAGVVTIAMLLGLIMIFYGIFKQLREENKTHDIN